MHVCIFVPVPAVFIHEKRASVSLRLTWDLLFQLSSPSCLLSLLCELIPCMTATLILFTDSFHPRQNKPSWYVSGCRSGSFFSWMSQHWFLAPCNKASFSQFDQWVLCIFLCLAVAMSNQEWWDFFFFPQFSLSTVSQVLHYMLLSSFFFLCLELMLCW